MCSIACLAAGTMLDHDLLFNAMHNNEHGIGVLLKENGKIHIKKELPAKVDVDKLYKYLEDNKDVERWFHLRNCSSGDVSKENVQPIQVYHSSKRSVFFMHNGTIYSQSIPESQKKHIDIDMDNLKLSDSLRFAMSKIAPVLGRTKGEDGPADLTDPFVQEIIYARWQQSWGKAVLISSDQPALLLNSISWEKIKNKDGTEFLASNDDYWKEIKRGTLFNQRKAEQEKKNRPLLTGPKIDKNSSMFTAGGRSAHVLEFPPFHKTLSLSENMVNILEEYDLYSPEGFVALSYIEQSELKKLFKDNLHDATTMFLYLTSYLRDATNSNRDLVKLVASQNLEIGKLKESALNGTKSDTTKIIDAFVG